jgi:hypothetical protein
MKWYRFWKDVHGHLSCEKYCQFSDEYSEDDIKRCCEEWAENDDSGHYAGYTYGFEIVEKPPKKWLITNITRTKDTIKNSKILLKEYEFWLNTYNLKSKIDKIINNINK